MRFARFALAAFAAAFCLTVAAPAHAQSVVQLRQDIDSVFTVDPTALVTATAGTFGPYDLARYTVGTCQLQNDAGASRVLTPSCMSDASSTATTLYSYPTVTVATAATGQWSIDPGASSATASTGTTVAPHPLCRYLKLSIAAAASTGKFGCTFRSRGR
jgi:hypothetical protein